MIRHVRSPWLGTLAVVFACRAEPHVPADFAESQARFRAEAEAEISGPMGPLSAVAAHYVEPGQALSLRVVDGRVEATPRDDPGSPVRLRVELDRIACIAGCDDGEHVDAPREQSLPPFRLGLSPQSGGLRVLVHDPQASARAAFEGLPWFPPEPRWLRGARLHATPDAEPEPLATTRGLAKPMHPAGALEVSLPDGGSAELRAYWASDTTLLVPFTDPSNGDTTYDVGRYLTVDASDLGAIVVDFNRATSPWCAYSEHYNCPIPPRANRLPTPVLAGEKYVH